MAGSRARCWSLLLPVLLLVLHATGFPPAPAAADPLPDPPAGIGRRLYREGLGLVGPPVAARVGAGDLAVPASAVPCIACHGADGKGRPEGGVTPSDIGWATLTKPYGHEHPGGRGHPAFDADSLRRALAEGIDPAGNPLDPAMPRYAVTAAEAVALAAYLDELDNDLGRGVTDDTVILGTVLPADGAAGAALRAVLMDWVDGLNRDGGINGRGVRLEIADSGADPAATEAATRSLIRDRGVFALVAPLTPGGEAALVRAAVAEATPVVGPFTPFPPETGPDNVYQLFPGMQRQLELLLRHARRDGPAGATLVLHDGDPRMAEFAARLVSSGTGAAIAYDGSETAAARMVALMALGRAARVLYLGSPAGMGPLAAALPRDGKDIDLLLPGWHAGLAALAASAGWKGRILVGLPMDPDSVPPAVRERITRIALTSGVGDGHGAVTAAGLAAAELAAEALRRAGRALRVEGFTDALNGIAGYESGLGQPVTFTPARRHGLNAIRVLILSNGGGRPAAAWEAGDP